MSLKVGNLEFGKLKSEEEFWEWVELMKKENRIMLRKEPYIIEEEENETT